MIPESEVDTYIEGSLAAEATMIVIDTLELLVQVCLIVCICTTGTGVNDPKCLVSMFKFCTG